MSDKLREVIERASKDAAFRSLLQSDPQAALAGYELTALAGYELTADERAALLQASAAPGEDFGVDARITKQVGNPGPGPIEIPSPSIGPFVS